MSSPSAAPAPTANSMLSKAVWTWTDKGMRDLFPTITDAVWVDFKSQLIDKFVAAHIVGTAWMQNFDTKAVAYSKAFQDFDDKVVNECSWITLLKAEQRRQLLIRLIKNSVQRVRDSARHKRAYKQQKRKSWEMQDDTGGETTHHGKSESIVEPPPIKREESIVSDFVTIDALVEDLVPATSLHLRLTRRLGSVHPKLCHQKRLVAYASQSYASTNKDLFESLDFGKLDTAAQLYLGFNVNDELFAIDYGAEHKPEWLFIQDNESFQSTLKTWHMQHPKTMIVEVLLFDRPGFIPYRTMKDLENAATGKKDDDELDSSDEDDENDEMRGGDEIDEDEKRKDEQKDEEEEEGDVVEEELKVLTMLRDKKRRWNAIARSQTDVGTGDIMDCLK